MNHVNREHLLRALSSVTPGLSSYEIVEHAGSFIFANDKILTYNEEITCSIESPLKGFKGAVRADRFLSILNKLSEEELEFQPKEGEIIFKHKKKRVGLTCEAEFQFPFEELESPTDWKTLPDDFAEAINYAKECTSTDKSKFVLTCIHVTPNYVEACDNYHMLRYKVKMPIKQPILVRKESLKHVIDGGMLEVAETDSWIHFRNGMGLVFSCRRWVEEFPDYSVFIKKGGEKVTFPGGLEEAVEKAEVFAADNVDTSVVHVSLKDGKVKIEGRGVHGWYQEIKQAKYDGPPLAFAILPKLLTHLSSLSSTCRVDANRLVVGSDKMAYSTCLEMKS